MNNVGFRHFGVMLDVSRNAVMKPETVKQYIDILSKLGYNCLMLYAEDIFEIEGHPYFGYKRGRYSDEEIKDMDAYAKEKGIELIPCVQALAHLDLMFRWNVYKDILDCNGILLAEEEKTYQFIDDMFKALSKSFSSRTVNIGMDEAFMLGKGNYFEKNGAKKRFDILLTHLNKVSEIADKYGFKIIMWGDMFFRLLSGGEYYVEEFKHDIDISGMIPDNVEIIYYDYYSLTQEKYDKQIKLHKTIKDSVWFAGGLWSWTGFTPHNKFSMDVTKKAFSACVENGIKDVFLTLWGDNGGECSKFALLPALYYASRLAQGIDDINKIKSGFYKEFGIEFDDFMLIDLPGTPNDSELDTVNASKYLLYNDCFTGLFNNIVKKDDYVGYLNLIEKLEELSIDANYGYLFKTAKELCRVLTIKSGLGSKTREFYMKNDISNLKDIISDYENLECLLEDFYDAFEKQWMKENKPNGFEVQDIRLGGLTRRIRHCKNIIKQYISGEIESIPELEEDVLDIGCRTEDAGKHLYYPGVWSSIVTVNKIG